MSHEDDEKRLLARLRAIGDRINKIADLEARSAQVGGAAARGALMPAKMKLIDENDRILDRLEDLAEQRPRSD